MSAAQEVAEIDAEILRLTTIREYLLEREKAVPRRRRRTANVKMTVAAAAEQALKGRRQPVRTRDLLPLVQELGARCKDGEALSKTLLRNPKFERVGRGLWRLKR